MDTFCVESVMKNHRLDVDLRQNYLISNPGIRFKAIRLDLEFNVFCQTYSTNE